MKDLQQALVEEDAALLAMDSDAFALRVRATRSLVSCLGERVAPPVAAAVELREAMAALIAGDESVALGWSRAARLADPMATLDPALMPEGHPLRDLLARADALAPPVRAPASLASGATLWVDGSAASGLLLDLPALAQVETQGVVRWSGLLEAGGALPVALTRPLPPEDPVAVTPPADPIVLPGQGQQEKNHPHRMRNLALGAGGSALASAGLFGLALASEARFKEGDVADTLDALDAARDRANGLTAGSAAAGAVALGLGVAAVLAF